MILFGSRTKPLRRLQITAYHPKLAPGDCRTQFKLRLDIAGVRFGAELGQHLAVRFALLAVDARQKHAIGAEAFGYQDGSRGK